MDFKNFGKVSFITETKVADFVSYLEQGRMMATRCRKCGTTYFPPKVDCPKCLLSDIEWFEIKGEGKLIAYTKVNYGPSEFEDEIPYTLAIGEFRDDIKIFSWLSRDIEESDIKIGMGIKVVPIKLPGNRISYEFQRS